jgi:translation initiation factor 2 subunit 3
MSETQIVQDNVITIKYSDIISKQTTINIGTIGHVSHGKTTTVGQLTGERTQKHEKEIIENKTIHIGYANSKVWLCSDTGDVCCTPATITHKVSEESGKPMTLVANISFVDCPGHADFMCTMIGGTSAMKAVFLLIAANDTVFPQNQTREHLLAMSTTEVDNYVVLQNKLDLVTEKQCLDSHKQISEFIQDTPAKGAPIIPVSAQLGQNMSIIGKYIANGIPQPVYDVNAPLKMFIIRSFDNNKPNTPIKKIIGGSIGGSIMQGSVQTGDYIEIRPGYIYQHGDAYVCQPIVSKVTSLYCGKEPLDIALPGGLKGIGMEFDPALSKLNGLAGQIAGTPGTLPEVYTYITFMYKTLNKKDKKKSLNDDEDIVICVNAKTVPAKVTGLFKKNKIRHATVKLSYPICIDTSLNMTVLRKVDHQLVINFIAKFVVGEVIENIVYPPEYQDIVTNIPKREIKIVYDIDYKRQPAKDYINYHQLVDNITFRKLASEDDDKFKMNYPDVKLRNRATIISNFSSILEAFNVDEKIKTGGDSIRQLVDALKNMESEIVDVSDFLHNFIKDELKTTGSIDEKERLILKGYYKNAKIESVLEKFVKKYSLCTNCNSCNTLMIKQKNKSKMMSIACLKCSAKIYIK